MRPIKFRAFDKKNKRMCKVVSMSSGVDAKHCEGWFVTIEWETDEQYTNGDVVCVVLQQARRDPSDVELMQFTGLHDRHRKEIYEGDIVKDIGSNVPREVKFGYYELTESMVIHGCISAGNKVLTTPLRTSKRIMDIEIIGNKWEDGYLLENKDA